MNLGFFTHSDYPSFDARLVIVVAKFVLTAPVPDYLAFSAIPGRAHQAAGAIYSATSLP